MSQLRKKANLLFLHIFVLFRSSIDWMRPTVLKESSLLSMIQMLVSSRNILTDTPGNNVLPDVWASLSSINLACKISRHKWELQGGREDLGYPERLELCLAHS